MEITYYKHAEINKLKWDRCVSQSVNGIVYAYSWYLDIVSHQWDGLVLGDYKAVMPLAGKRRYGLSYINQPNFCAQLGVFSTVKLDNELVNNFLSAIPDKFRYINIYLNTYNKASHPRFNQKEEFTCELDLIAPYKMLYLKFNDQVKRAITLSKKNKVQVMKHVNLKDFLLLKKQTSKDPVTFEQLNILRRIIPFTINHNLGTTLGAYDDKNQLVAAAYFIKSHQKTINLLSAVAPEGEDIGAIYAIYNHYIKTNAEKTLTLDFNGTAIDNKQEIYNGFGAKTIKYLILRQNRLPWVLRFFK